MLCSEALSAAPEIEGAGVSIAAKLYIAALDIGINIQVVLTAAGAACERGKSAKPRANSVRAGMAVVFAGTETE